MAEDNPESLGWLDKLAAIKAQLENTPSANRASLAKALNFSESIVAYLRPLIPVLDPAAVEKIRMAAKGNPPFILSFKGAHPLARLRGRVPDLALAVHDALDQILSRRFKKRHITALVNHIISSKPAKDFDPKTVKNKKPFQWTPPVQQPQEELSTPGQSKDDSDEKLTLKEGVGGCLGLIFLLWLAIKLFHWVFELFQHLAK